MSLEATIADAVREVVRQEIRNLAVELRKATDDRTITQEEAAQMLRVSSRSIRRMIQMGQITPVVIGKFRRIRVGDLPSRKQ